MPADVLENIGKASKDEVDAVKKLEKEIQVLEKHTADLAKAQEKVIGSTDDFTKKIKSLTKVQKDYQIIAKDLEKLSKDGLDTDKKQLESITKLKDIIDKSTESIKKQNESYKFASKLTHENLQDIRDKAKALEKLNRIQGIVTQINNSDTGQLKRDLSRSKLDKALLEKEIRDLQKEQQEQKSNKKAGIIGGKIKEKHTDELRDVNNSLGENLTGWAAIGAATIYASKKAKEYVGNAQNAAVSFTKFRVDQSALSLNTLVAPDGTKQLEDLRNNLGLTRQEFGAFSGVLLDAANNGIKSTEELGKAGEKLRNTFGGDQTDRLKEYVGLLKEIPTLDTDLSITASTDDTTAAYFALAKSGKVSQTIELQSAGLLGGAGEGTGADKSDIDTLNAAQKSAATVENIEAFLTKTFYPSFGPWLSESLGGIFSIAGGVTGITGSTLALKTLISSGLNPKVDSLADRALVAEKQRLDTNDALHEANTKLKNINDTLHHQQKEVSSRDKEHNNGLLKQPFQNKGPKPKIPNVNPLKSGQGASDFFSKAAKIEKLKGGLGGGITSGIKGSITQKIEQEATQLAESALPGILGKIAPLASAAGIGGVAEGGALAGGGALAAEGGVGAAGGVGLAGAATVGAVLVAIAALGVGAYKVGESFEGLSKSSKNEGENLSVIGKSFVGFKEGIDELGSSLSSGVKRISDGFSDFGDYLLLSSKGYSDEKNKQAEKKKEDALLAKRIKLDKGLNDEIEKYIKKQQQSALALQSFSAATENASKTAKVQLYEFGQQLAETNIGVFAEIGGSLENFEGALDSAAINITKKFDTIGKTLDDVRTKISKNKDLTGEQRQIALNQVKEKELDASRHFVSSLLGLVGKFDEVPEIIQAKLSQKLSALNLDIGTSTGSLSGSDITENLRSQINDLTKVFIASKTVARGDNEKTGNIGIAIEGRNKEINQGVKNSLNTGEFKNEDSKAFIKQIQDAFRVGTDEDLNKIYADIDSNIKKSSPKDIDKKLAGLLSEKNKLNDSYNTENLNYGKKNAEKNNVVNSLNGKKNITSDQLDTYDANVGAAKKGLEEQGDKLAKVKRELEDKEKEISDLISDEGLSFNAQTKAEKEALKAKQEGSATVEQLAMIDRKIAEEGQSRYNTASDSIKESERLKGILDKTGAISNSNVAKAKATNISMTGLLDNLKGLLSTIDEIKDIAEKSAEVQGAKRSLEIVEAQVVYSSAIGSSFEALNSVVKAQLKVQEETKAQLDNSKKLQEDITAKLSDIGALYKNQAAGYVADLENAKKELSDPSLSKKTFFSNNSGTKNILKKSGKELENNTPVNIPDLMTDIIDRQEAIAKERLKDLDTISPTATSDERLKAEATFNKKYEAEEKDHRDALNDIIENANNKDIAEQARKVLQSQKINSAGSAPLVGRLTQVTDSIAKQVGTANSAIAEAFDKMLHTLENVPQQFNIKAFSETADTAAAQQELASSSRNRAGIDFATNKGAEAITGEHLATVGEINKAASPEGLEKTFQDALSKMQENINKLVLTPGSDENEIKKLKTEKEIYAITGKRRIEEFLIGKSTKESSSYVRKIKDNFAKAREFADAQIEVDKSLVEQRTSFLENTGGSAGQITASKQQALALEAISLDNLRTERDRLGLARDAAATDADKNALNLDFSNKSKEVAIAELKIKEKGIGAQRDAYDKLIAHAFGGLRSSVGARRGATSEAQTFGRNRVQLGSGLNVSGGSTTLEQRQASATSAIAGFGQNGDLSAGLLGSPSRGSLDKSIQTGKSSFKTLGDLAGKNNGNVSGGNSSSGSANANTGVSSTPDLASNTAQKVKVDVNVDVKFDDEMFTAKVRKIVTLDPTVLEKLDSRYVQG